ncbi:MAG: NUDIX domain-containing protein [Mobilitalea sp.]
MEITLDLKNYNPDNAVFKRTAARGIINDGDKYLLIFSRYGDYKFPGGGVEKGEELENTLIREVAEETGYQVIKNSTEKYCKVFERRKGEYDDILEMESHYFRCKVEEVVGSRNLDEYEEEYDYQIVWMTLPEAIEKNNAVIDLVTCPWVMRDTRVMELLVQEQYLN